MTRDSKGNKRVVRDHDLISLCVGFSELTSSCSTCPFLANLSSKPPLAGKLSPPPWLHSMTNSRIQLQVASSGTSLCGIKLHT